MNDHSEDTAERIRQRAGLLRDLRSWFDARGFLEVQPPCLSRECIVDLHIDPICVPGEQLGLPTDASAWYFLQTSPEAAMKRLLAAGAPSIYSIGPVFRGGERGSHHNVEFTMMEWYQLESGYAEGVRLLGALAAELLNRDRFDVVCYRDVFCDQVGCDPISSEIALLQEHAARIDRELSDSLAGDRDGLLDVIWASVIQPELGRPRPIVVKNYPLTQAALAKVSDDDPECAERFELFADGIELANGYHELGDADVLQQRLERSNRERKRMGKQELPLPHQFLEAMRKGLPPCAGVALGVDRLLMIRTGVTEISNVLTFPIESA